MRRGRHQRSFAGRYDLRERLRPPLLRLRDPPRLRGTLPPARRASLNPIAIACFRLVTFFPERPERSFPRLRSCIARFTFCWAFFPYFAMQRPPPGLNTSDVPYAFVRSTDQPS